MLGRVKFYGFSLDLINTILVSSYLLFIISLHHQLVSEKLFYYSLVVIESFWLQVSLNMIKVCIHGV